MKILAPVFLYPIWQEKSGQPDPLAPDYVGTYSPQASTTASTPTPTSTSSTSPDTIPGTSSSDDSAA